MTKDTQPYELLVRWRNGKLSGSHIQFIQRIIDDDGKILQETPLDPIPIGGDKGFPLEDVLSKIHIDALASLAIEQDARKVAEKQLEENNNEMEKYLEDKKKVQDTLKTLSESL